MASYLGSSQRPSGCLTVESVQHSYAFLQAGFDILIASTQPNLQSPPSMLGL